jgi:hypothetical protein
MTLRFTEDQLQEIHHNAGRKPGGRLKSLTPQGKRVFFVEREFPP